MLAGCCWHQVYSAPRGKVMKQTIAHHVMSSVQRIACAIFYADMTCLQLNIALFEQRCTISSWGRTGGRWNYAHRSTCVNPALSLHPLLGCTDGCCISAAIHPQDYRGGQSNLVGTVSKGCVYIPLTCSLPEMLMTSHHFIHKFWPR